MAVPKQQAFFGVQALRGLAATLVVIHHATGIWNADFVDPNLVRSWQNGAAGVDIFFVISGFVMAYSSTGERRPTPSNFLARRLLRIAPMYWLITLLTAAKMLAVRLRPNMGSIVDHAHLTWPYLVASLCFIPFRNSLGAIEPVLAVGWTLDYEMFFYLLFALALLAARRARVPLLVSVTVAIVPLSFLGLWLRPDAPAILSLCNPILLEFLAGVVVGLLVRRGARLRAPFAAILAVAGLVVLLTRPMVGANVREFTWGLAALALVAGTVLLEPVLGRRTPAIVLMIGDASYSLYLIHTFLIFAVGRSILKVTHAPVPEWAFVLGSTALSIGAGFLLYRFIERPVTLALGRWMSVRNSPSIVGTENLKPVA